MNQDIFNPTRVTATVGGKEIIFETGRLANQAHGAVWVQCGGTVVLVTVCSQALEFDKGFFPLTVEYSEKMYAAGRIPGSFFRREIGRPSERETLVSRLIDRPIRPLFPKGLNEDVQVLASVISADQENESDVLALTGASAAVMLSPLPFEGPVAGGRIGRIDGQFVLNPTFEEQERSDLNIVFAASRDALTMVEGEATFVPEDVIIDALEWGRKEIQPLIDAQLKLRELAGKEKMPFTPHQDDPVLVARVQELAREMVTYYDQRPELGKNYTAKVKKIMEIGAIVEVLPNVEALVHVSQLDVNRVEQPGDVARLGEDMVVKVIEINGDRIRASRKAVLLEEQGHPWNPEETARPQRDRGDRGNRGDRGDRGGRRERGDRGDRGGRGDRR